MLRLLLPASAGGEGDSIGNHDPELTESVLICVPLDLTFPDGVNF